MKLLIKWSDIHIDIFPCECILRNKCLNIPNRIGYIITKVRRVDLGREGDIGLSHSPCGYTGFWEWNRFEFRPANLLEKRNF